jgi:S1-C subfamily serine protease
MNDAQHLSSQLADAVESVAQSVVRIESGRRRPASGVVWSDDGLIVTVAHAVERDDRIGVGLPNGDLVEATIVGRDSGTDVALLRLASQKLPAAGFRKLDGARVGQLAIAVGRPGKNARASLGVLSALGESWRTPSGGTLERFVQPDIGLSIVHSGSVLVDVEARAFGLNTAALLRGAALTVPTVTLERVVSALLEHGRVRRGYLGVAVHPARLPSELASSLGQEAALIAVAIQPGGPGQGAGVLLGDVLLELGGVRLGSVGELQSVLDEQNIEQELALRVLRAGRVEVLSLRVGARP